MGNQSILMPPACPPLWRSYASDCIMRSIISLLNIYYFRSDRIYFLGFQSVRWSDCNYHFYIL